MDTQVLIVGAGPAGSSAAYFLAQKGIDVLLIDRTAFPREKICGDGVSPAGVRILAKMGILDAFPAGQHPRVFEGVHIHASDGHSVRLHYPWQPENDHSTGVGYVIPRQELDALLLQQAVAAGAQFLPGCQATDPIQDAGCITGFQCNNDGQQDEIRAHLTVVATGAFQRIVRDLGYCPTSAGATIGIRGYLRHPPGAFPEPYLEIYLDPHLLPDYGWAFPVNDQVVNVGLALANHRRGRDSGTLRSTLHSFVKTHPVLRAKLGDAEWIEPVRGCPLFADFLARTTFGAGILIAGEAAGLVDPLTGEGISFALQSGELAARAAYEAVQDDDFSARKLSAYGRELRRRYATYFGYASRIRARLTDPELANVLVSLARQLQNVRAQNWAPAAVASLAWLGLRSLRTLGSTPYLAYRLLRSRRRSIEELGQRSGLPLRE